MGSQKPKLPSKSSISAKIVNKEKRQKLYIQRKKEENSLKRDERFRRRREEEKNPSLRENRLKHNVPQTLERKRVWDDVENDRDNLLGVSVDLERRNRQRLEDTVMNGSLEDGIGSKSDEVNDDRDSMIDDMSDEDCQDKELRRDPKQIKRATELAPSPACPKANTNLDSIPDKLSSRFPTLFAEKSASPKILVTTSINSSLHYEAQLLTTLFPHSVYIPRSAHHYSYKFSVREISSFATNRNYTAVLVLKEDQKKPTGLTIVHLPHGPTFHFSISNWVEGKKLPGHGKPSDHSPELILNNFRTPLGLLTANLFRTLFPSQPELQGRQVVTLHNQRDYIFLRRHRYIFREKRTTEKSVVGPDGNEIKGVEGIRAGLQELGPRFTLKLRRIDKGIQRASSQEFVWKGKMEKTRTKFQL